jgi:hypothetical protein
MNFDTFRKILNILFLIGAVASVAVYFVVEDRTVFFYVCGITLCIKVMEFFIRFTFK